MPAPSGNQTLMDDPGSRLDKLGIVLPAPPIPLGSYVESSDTADLLFLSGMLPIVNRKLAISGRLGENLSAKEGQDAASIASLNALAAAKQHLGTLYRLKKLVKLTVLMATTEQFTDHAPVADGASKIFAQIFGPEAGHTRLVYGDLRHNGSGAWGQTRLSRRARQRNCVPGHVYAIDRKSVV